MKMIEVICYEWVKLRSSGYARTPSTVQARDIWGNQDSMLFIFTYCTERLRLRFHFRLFYDSSAELGSRPKVR